jgi:hypothetical protein
MLMKKKKKKKMMILFGQILSEFDAFAKRYNQRI